MSGGVDSSVCAALAVRAVGADRVFGLLLPERESDPQSLTMARAWAEDWRPLSPAAIESQPIIQKRFLVCQKSNSD